MANSKQLVASLDTALPEYVVWHPVVNDYSTDRFLDRHAALRNSSIHKVLLSGILIGAGLCTFVYAMTQLIKFP